MTPSRAAEVLGVELGISVEALKQRWRQLARELHPDLAGPGHLDQFVLARQAYDTLLPVRISASLWCEGCGGSGRISTGTRGFGGTVDMRCPTCDGAGRKLSTH